METIPRYPKLVAVVDAHAAALRDRPESTDPDTIELLHVLRRMLDGKPALKAFGAPGDWGYGTPIGDALYETLRQHA